LQEIVAAARRALRRGGNESLRGGIVVAMLARDRCASAMRPLVRWFAVLLLAGPAVSQAAPKPSNPKVIVTPKRVVAANVRAASSIYRAAVFEEMKLFAVADRIAQQFLAGLLPVSKGTESRILDYVGGESAPLSEASRRRIYSHVLGGSTPEVGHRNAALDPLLARFLAVTGKLGKRVKGTDGDDLHRSARALALNLSNHGYGATTIAARLLEHKLELAQAIIADPDVLKSHGVSDPLALVERMAEQELGVTVDAHELRARAEAATVVLDWLAKVAEPLSSTGGAPGLAADCIAARVPGSARSLGRTVVAEHTPQAAASEHLSVHALCLDAKLRLVDCIVETADE
jgi:hypothetical protein